MVQCELCTSPGGVLRTVCPCHKKNDTGVHLACLRTKYEAAETHQSLTCPTCHQAYQISVSFRVRLSWEHLLFDRTRRCCGDIVIVFIVIWSLLFTFAAYLRGLPSDWSQRPGGLISFIFIVLLVFITVLLIPLTVRVVLRRWIKSHSVVDEIYVV